MTGEILDVYQCLDFRFYDWAWHKENAGLVVPRLGRFLGVVDAACNVHSFHVIPESGTPIVADAVERETQLELETDVNKQRINSINDKIADRFKEGHLHDDVDKPNLEDWGDLHEEDEDEDFIA